MNQMLSVFIIGVALLSVVYIALIIEHKYYEHAVTKLLKFSFVPVNLKLFKQAKKI